MSPSSSHFSLLSRRNELLDRLEELPPATVSALVEELRHDLSACAAYIPSRLVRSQLSHPQPGRISGAFWHGTILFADLSGFTAFCDKLSILGKQGAEEVSVVVNRLFNELVAEVLAHQGELLSYRGELLKFGGDALTAFFDEEVLGSNHAAAATLAALGMQERMEAFSSIRTRAGSFRLRLRVGVHSGDVFAAEVGDQDHIELIVTGANVNLVASAQSIAAPGEVVISGQTAKLLDGAALIPRAEGFFQITSLPDVPLPPSRRLIDPTDGTLASTETIRTLASQVEALYPYLVRGLPRRFFDTTISELGEFRPVSVIFINFYDFSNLLCFFGDDTDSAARALNAYFRHIQQIVHNYDGIINKVDMYTHGDKVMALFGAPSAHEDDPLRAVRCALELEGALREANREISKILRAVQEQRSDQAQKGQGIPDIPDTPEEHLLLRQCIGINVGTVFAGRVGGSQRYEYTVMGPAVNLAARLMEAADEGTVLISPDVRSAVDQHVPVEPQSPIYIKGFAEPIIPARARAGDYITTTHTYTVLGQPPLVGREKELEVLLDKAKTALCGKGRILAIAGDVGVGKTRLLGEFVRTLVLTSVSGDPITAIPDFQISMASGQSFTQSVPYVTIRPPLSDVLRIVRRPDEVGEQQKPEEEIAVDVQARVERFAPELSHFAPLLGDVLGMNFPDTPLTRALSVEQRHSRVQELVTAIFVGAATHEPLLLVFDDLQWADSSSQELLNRLAHVAHKVPLLMIFCYRVHISFSKPWADIPTTVIQTLTELSDENIETLLEGMFQTAPPPEILPLFERTQGNPFFLEELARALVTSGMLARTKSGKWQLTRRLDEVTVPTSIEGLITSRLDQLDDSLHELVQIASVVGYRFELPILQGFYNESFLHKSLERLIEEQLVIPDEQHGESTYLFRHALLRDVAYEGILYSYRRELHHRVARRIEELSTGYLDEHLALLAQHYLLAEQWEPAFHYHKAAGIQSQKRYANREALALFAKAIEVVPHLEQYASSTSPPTPPAPISHYSTEQERDATTHLSSIALQVAELNERSAYIHALLGEYEHAESFYRAALQTMQKLMEDKDQYWSLEHNCENSYLFPSNTIVRLYRHLATIHEQRGNYEQSFEWLHHGMDKVTKNSQEELARCYLLGSRLYYTQGQHEMSLEWAKKGLAVAETLEKTIDQAHALLLMGNIWRDKGAYTQSITALEKARSLLDEMKDASRSSDALNNLGDAYYRIGRWQEAIKCHQKSLQISENIGDVLGMARTSNNLASVMIARGEIELAAELFKYSSEQFRRVGSWLGLAVTGYKQGEVLLHQGRSREALHNFLTSISSLEHINARVDLPDVLRLAAEASLMLNETEHSHTYASRSLAIARELGMAVEEALAHWMLGQIAMHQQAYPDAHELFETSRALLEKLDNPYGLGKVLFWQSKLAYARGHYDHDQVIAPLEQAQQIFKKLRAKHDLSLIKEFVSELKSSDQWGTMTAATC